MKGIDMSTNHIIVRRGGFEFCIDEHSNRFDLSMFKISIPGYESSASMEINDFTIDELEKICLKMMEILSYYHRNPQDVIATLFKKVPEYSNKLLKDE